MDTSSKTPVFYVAIANSAKNVREASLRQYGRLWEAYTTMGHLLSSLVEQGNENPLEVSESASQRIAVTAGLLQSVVIAEQTISAGFYWAASALLRQHMEALARVIQIRSGGPAVDKKPPNVSVLPFGLCRNYGRLSQLAHLTNGELFNDFAIGPDGDEIANFLPRYHEDWSRDLLVVHISHLIVLAKEIHFIHQELYPKRSLFDIDVSIFNVTKILADEGFWKELNCDGKDS
jgi:hypothetical protein